ncbi:hypothetical protein B0H13DRAFT_1904401 [Mycena leptocephala]|nr:hypothetical protein B0H13DRAFT_1904401 [Mycena leptocephala]
MSAPSARRARARAKRLPNAAASTSGQTTTCSLSFGIDELMPLGDVDRPINSFVDRPSEDLRRIHRDVVPIEPPSPVKNARIAAVRGETSMNAPMVESGIPDSFDDRYEMFNDVGDDPPVVQTADLPRARKAMFSDQTLYDWRDRSRDRYLLEFLRLDGCIDASELVCPGCKKRSEHTAYECSSECEKTSEHPAYRCRECKGGLLFCRDCCVQRHLDNPLHIIEAWTGTYFVKTSLQALGLRVQFGHPPGEYCANPEAAYKDFVVIHDNGIHEVSVDFCGCENRSSAGPLDTQLLRGGWYPASEERPKSCMTLLALEKFHLGTLQAKTTMYDFYRTLEKLTSNDGTKPPDRYQVMIRICREYRHLMMLKRGGRGHCREGAMGRSQENWRFGVNLPDDWESASKEDRFIYILFLALDACFRLKRGLVSSDLKDPGLGTGWAYMTENVPYREYLLTVTDQKEMSTCSGLAALDYANTKFSRGYSTTGVGMGVCARHEFIQPNGVGDLQKGERYANMDYVLGSLMRHHDPLLRKIISYDIVCQWWKLLMERLRELPPLVRCFIILPMIAFVIPKLHIHGHTGLCGILYSLNLIPGSGQTDGEGIERPWANIGGIASSTRIMGPGARHDAVDDHWGHWNWQKKISLAESLRRRLDVALEQQIVQREALKAFSEQQQERVEGWKTMVHEYEEDSGKKNPYEAVVSGLTEAQVRLQFQQEEEEEARRGVPAKHKVSASTFMVECLDVEEEQRRVRVQAELKKAQTTAQQIDMSSLRTKLIRRLERLRKMQGTYSPASMMALESREAPADELPENEPLFLPSALSEAERATGCSKGLLEMELLLRDAQCRGALVRLRNQLHIKARYLNYKMLHARHQGANTRSRTIVNRNETKIRLHSEKYQAAWGAMMAITGGNESEVGWKKLRKEDIRCMQDADDLARKEEKRKKAVLKRKRKYQELLAHGETLAGWEDDVDENEDDGVAEGRVAGESRREVSWIWTAAGASGTDAGFEDALRIEWAKAYARSRRWDEEVRHLKEEFRRLPISLEFEADLWDERLKQVPVGVLDVGYTQGMVAYAAKQAALFRDIAARARKTETEPKLMRGKKRPRAPMVDPLLGPTTIEDLTRGGEREDDESEEEGDEDDRGMVQGMESDEDVIMGGELDDE